MLAHHPSRTDAAVETTEPTKTTESMTPLPRRSPRERIDLRVAMALGVAWFVLPEITVLIEPAPRHADPAIGVVLSAAMNVVFVALLFGLAMRRRWGLQTSLGGAVLLTAMAVACPTTGHHQFGLWWFGEMACVLALVAGSVWALRRPPVDADGGVSPR